MEVDKWLARSKKRKQATLNLADALLNGQWVSYFYKRLKYFFLNLSLGQSLHLVEVLLLFHIFKGNSFYILAILSFSFSFAIQFWWGVLESYREDIRQMAREGSHYKVTNYIGEKVKSSILLASSLLLAFVISYFLLGYLNLIPKSFLFLSMLVTYILRFLFGIIYQTLHSGIYAITRIYRPMWAMISLELTSFALLLIIWPIDPVWALPLATFIAFVLNSAISLHFALRCYNQHIGVLQLKGSKFARFSWNDLFAGIAFSLISLDLLVVLFFFNHTPQFSFSSSFNELFLFISIFPLMQASLSWVRLMYFDLTKLQAHKIRNLFDEFSAKLGKLGVIVALLLSGISFICIGLAVGKNIGLYWFLIPLFLIIRSYLAQVKMRVFVEGGYRLLTLIGGLTIIVQLVVVNTFISGELKFSLYSGFLLLTSFVFYFSKRKVTSAHYNNIELVNYIKKNLAKLERVFILSFTHMPKKGVMAPLEQWAEDNLWYHNQILRKLTGRSTELKGALSYPGRLVLASESKKIDSAYLIQQLGGELITTVELKAEASLPDKLVKELCSEQVLALSKDQLIKVFKKNFPNGEVILINKVKTKKDESDYRDILRKLVYFKTYLSYPRGNNITADALFNSNSELEVAFVYQANWRGVKNWQKTIFTANWQYA